MFVHELGHVIAVRLAAISALAGPIAGLLGVRAVLGVAESLNSDFLRTLAYTAFFLNNALVGPRTTRQDSPLHRIRDDHPAAPRFSLDGQGGEDDHIVQIGASFPIGAVALAVRLIKAGLSSEVSEVGSPVFAAELGVCRVSVPTGGDRGRGAVVPALLLVLPRCRGAAGRARC